MTTDQNIQTTGAVLGGLLGFAKNIALLSVVTWSGLIDTMIFSGVGTLVGLIITTLFKYFKSKFKRHEKIHTEGEGGDSRVGL